MEVPDQDDLINHIELANAKIEPKELVSVRDSVDDAVLRRREKA